MICSYIWVFLHRRVCVLSLRGTIERIKHKHDSFSHTSVCVLSVTHSVSHTNGARRHSWGCVLWGREEEGGSWWVFSNYRWVFFCLGGCLKAESQNRLWIHEWSPPPPPPSWSFICTRKGELHKSSGVLKCPQIFWPDSEYDLSTFPYPRSLIKAFKAMPLQVHRHNLCKKGNLNTNNNNNGDVIKVCAATSVNLVCQLVSSHKLLLF